MPKNFKAQQWNERLRLVIAFFNITAIGTFGLAVTAPILEAIKLQRSASGSWEKFNTLTELKFGEGYGILDIALDVVAWELAAAAFLLHVFAHILVGLMEPEE